MSLHQVHLCGSLTHAPRLRRSPSDTPVCTASLLINQRYKRGDDWVREPVLVDIVLFGLAGEAFARHHNQGEPALIRGRLSFDQWEDFATGELRTKLYVVAEEWEFVGSGKKTAELQEGSHEPSW